MQVEREGELIYVALSSKSDLPVAHNRLATVLT
jgi:hypothetical protein